MVKVVTHFVAFHGHEKIEEIDNEETETSLNLDFLEEKWNVILFSEAKTSIVNEVMLNCLWS